MEEKWAKGLEEEAVKTGPLEQVRFLSKLDSKVSLISVISVLHVSGLLGPERGAGEPEPAADGCAQQEVHPPGGHR